MAQAQRDGPFLSEIFSASISAGSDVACIRGGLAAILDDLHIPSRRQKICTVLNMADRASVAIIGASSLVGSHLISQLQQQCTKFIAFTTGSPASFNHSVEWQSLFKQTTATPCQAITHWIYAAPIWTLPEHFEFIRKNGAKRIVVLSTTSVISKTDSENDDEKNLARDIAAAETQLTSWAQDNCIEWSILRPTLIYGNGKDKNIARIARLIKKFRCFPVLWPASGLRQPIHAGDVAAACIAALRAEKTANQIYNLSGRETITYREMIDRIFQAMHIPSRIVPLPLFCFSFVSFLTRKLFGNSSWTTAMIARMNQDLVFDHSKAFADFGFSPRPFNLREDDL